MKFLYVSEPVNHPSAYYRAVMPMAALHELGQDIVVDTNVGMMSTGRFGKLINGQVYDPDIIVLRRMANDNTDVITQARKNGQLVFMDVDDDMWHLPEWNPIHTEMTDDVKRLMIRQMNLCDGVLTTTPELKQVMRGMGVDVPITVTVNAMNMDVYNEERHEDEHEPFRLGWMGATNYRWRDLESILVPLRDALVGQRGKVEFWHYGAHPDLPNVADLVPSGFFPVEVQMLEWTVPSLVPRQLAQLDAMLIPQVRNIFANSRSATTGIACCAAGVPFIATQTPAYQRLWNRGAGYPANTADEWRDAIRMMIDPAYAEARRGMRMGGYAVARDNTIQQLAVQLTEVFLWPKVSAKL